MPLDLLSTAMLGNLWPFMVRADQYIREAFVVPQQHIVRWLVALDQLRLEQQRLAFCLGCHNGDVVHQGDHARRAIGVALATCIRGDPVLEVFGLADIEDIAILAQHAIDAGCPRQAFNLGTDEVFAMQIGQCLVHWFGTGIFVGLIG